MKNGHSEDMIHFTLLVKLVELKNKISAKIAFWLFFTSFTYEASPP